MTFVSPRARWGGSHQDCSYESITIVGWALFALALSRRLAVARAAEATAHPAVPGGLGESGDAVHDDQGRADGGAVYNLAYGNDVISGGAVSALLSLNSASCRTRSAAPI
jgi:hypothetical protein